MRRAAWAMAVCLTGASLGAMAHEVRPAYLQLEEVQPAVFQMLWKQPVLGARRLPIEPVLPAGCNRSPSTSPAVSNGALLEQWRVACDLRTGTVTVQGLERTLTDVLVEVRYLDGERVTALLRGAEPSLDLADPAPTLSGYLRLGVEHLLTGVDHILFVVGLVLFIPGRWDLLKAITAFTAAHSLTLALSVLGLVVLPQGPVEAVIALSILFLARELVVPEARRSAITRARPWLMAFAFGLLHGFGFAGALADIGLPRDQLALALLLFNIGIELGQLMIIAALLAAGAALRMIWSRSPRTTAAGARGFASAMGVAAAFWTIDRIALIL